MNTGSNNSVNVHFAKAVKRAIEIKYLSQKDLFLTDSLFLHKLTKCRDELVKIFLIQSKNPEMTINKPGCCYEKHKVIVKFRGIDPMVRTSSNKLIRLSQIDPLFSSYYEYVREWSKYGLEIYTLCSKNT